MHTAICREAPSGSYGTGHIVKCLLQISAALLKGIGNGCPLLVMYLVWKGDVTVTTWQELTVLHSCRTRGIDYATARQVLVYSFGNEVTQHFKHPLLIQRIQENVNATLRLASLS